MKIVTSTMVVMLGLACFGGTANARDEGRPVASSAQSADVGEQITYLIEGDDLKQVLQVRMRGRHQIEFTAKIESPCKRTVTGVAVSRHGDPEIDEDDNGVAYPAEEFAYKGRDRLELWVRIDMKKHRYARIKVLDESSAKCQFSEDLMKRA